MSITLIKLNEPERKMYDSIINAHKHPDKDEILNFPEVLIVSEAIVQLYFAGPPDRVDINRWWSVDNLIFGKRLYQKSFAFEDDILRYLNELCEKYSATKHRIVLFALVCFDSMGCMDETSTYMYCRKWMKAREYRELTGELLF